MAKLNFNRTFSLSALIAILLLLNVPSHASADDSIIAKPVRNLLENSDPNQKDFFRRGKLISKKEEESGVQKEEKDDTRSEKEYKSLYTGLLDGFISSFSMILVSEIGDETFIIAALMAMRHPRSIVLAGALCALGIMTVLSTGLGLIVPNLISRKATNGAATILYTFFGLRLLYIAWKSDPNDTPQKEMEEVEEKLELIQQKPPSSSSSSSSSAAHDHKYRDHTHDEDEGVHDGLDNDSHDKHDANERNDNHEHYHPHDLEMKQVEDKLEIDVHGKSKQRFVKRFLARFCTPVFLEAFILTFLAEWGDRSQIATIALAAHKNPIGVTVGATMGHVICTTLAVIGGRLLALRISQRTVAMVGGLLFLAFAVNSFLHPPL